VFLVSIHSNAAKILPLVFEGSSAQMLSKKLYSGEQKSGDLKVKKASFTIIDFSFPEIEQGPLKYHKRKSVRDSNRDAGKPV